MSRICDSEDAQSSSHISALSSVVSSYRNGHIFFACMNHAMDGGEMSMMHTVRDTDKEGRWKDRALDDRRGHCMGDEMQSGIGAGGREEIVEE